MEGDTVCHIVMATRIRKMVLKKIAVGRVHSIHSIVKVIVPHLIEYIKLNIEYLWNSVDFIICACRLSGRGKNCR